MGCFRTALDERAVLSLGDAGSRDALPDAIPDAAPDAPPDVPRDLTPDVLRDLTPDLALGSGDVGPDLQLSDGSQCPADILSNATQATAYALRLPTSGTRWGLADLWVCPGQEDWFVLDLPAGYEAQVEGCYDAGPSDTFGHLTVDFFREEFQDPSQYAGGGSYGGGGICEGTNIVSAPGRYYFKITSDRPQRYRIGLFAGAVSQSCTPDAYEPNDTAETAARMTIGQSYDGLSCPTDLDWYSLQVTEGQQLTIKLDGWFNGYELEMALLAPEDLVNPLATFHYATGTSRPVSHLVTKSGVLLFRLRNTKGINRGYTLTVTS